MSRDTPKAPTVGHCHCPNPHCGKLAAIRRNKSGKHYAVCQVCGPIYWLTPAGQEFFLNEGTIWGAAGAPQELPEWIRDGKVAPRSGNQAMAEKTPQRESPTPEPKQQPMPQPKPSPAVQPKPAPAPKPAPRPWWQF